MTTIGHYRYEIDSNNEIWIWDNDNPNENDKPFFHQPDYPDSRPWENREAAEAWVTDMLNNLLQAEAEKKARLEQEAQAAIEETPVEVIEE